jgi:tetratricopeptide (TPR) repeat protein
MVWTALLLACLIVWQGAVWAQGYSLQSIKGRVERQVGGQGAWKAVTRSGQVASTGDRLRTGPDGSVTIVTSSGQRVSMGPNTTVALKEPNQPSGWRVFAGKILATLTGGKRLEVRAPGAVAAAEGTVFQVEVGDDGLTTLTVTEGTVDFSNDLGAVTVLASQQSTARPGSAPTRPVVIDPSGMVAWEASLQTLIVEPEYPQVGTDPDELQRLLNEREQALQAAPQSAAAHAAVAQVRLDLRQTEGALEQAEAGLALAPTDAALNGLVGFALLQAGHPTEAQERFTAAAAADTTQARWQIGLALVAMGQRDVRPAEGLLRQAATLAPQDPVPHAYLAATGLRLGDLEAAKAAAAEATRLGPDNHLANGYAAYVRLAEGDAPGAVAAAEKAVAAAPKSAFAQEALGTARFFAGNPRAAGQALETSLALNPLSAGAHLTHAKLLAAEDDIASALDEAEVAVSLNPQSAPARSALGLLFLLNNDSQRAGREFSKALALDPSLSEARTGWGAVLAKRGRFREALDEQKVALSLDTNSASAENNLGGVCASLGQMDEATEHLNRAIELQPEWGLPHANLAMVHLEQNQYPEALAEGEKAVKLGERSAFVHTVLARIYVRQGRTDRAMAQLRQALAVDEDYPQARFQLAKLYLLQDRARDSVRETLAAVNTDSSAMLETRRYARTEISAAGGNYGTWHVEGRHSNASAGGKISYFASGMVDETTGWRSAENDRTERFGEAIVGYQPDADRQWTFWGSLYDSDTDLPGAETAGSLGDPDDTGAFTGHDAVLAYRQRLSPDVTATGKYSHRHGEYRFRNPDSLTGLDTNPFSVLNTEDPRHSLEARVDAQIGDRTSLRAGFSRLWEERELRGTAGVIDPNTGVVTPTPFADQTELGTDTAWLEAERRCSDRLRVTLGGYYGRQDGSGTVALPKAVALYRPDSRTWVALMAIPILRPDAAELSPVEPFANPFGLGYLNFAEGGAGRSYELRLQRQTGGSANVTAGVAYQRVRGLLIDTEDPSLTGLPSRVLVDRGHRWVAEASYEQWLADCLTGRAWVRWQDTSASVAQLQIVGAEWPYAPTWQCGGRLDYIADNGLRVGLEGVWVDERFHDAASTQVVPSHVVLNLRAEYQRNLHENYFLQIGNLTDEGYVTYQGFPQAGTTVLGGIEYRF